MTWSWGDHHHHFQQQKQQQQNHTALYFLCPATPDHDSERAEISECERKRQVGSVSFPFLRHSPPWKLPLLHSTSLIHIGVMEVPTFLLSSLALLALGGDIFTRWDSIDSVTLLADYVFIFLVDLKRWRCVNWKVGPTRIHNFWSTTWTRNMIQYKCSSGYNVTVLFIYLLLINLHLSTQQPVNTWVQICSIVISFHQLSSKNQAWNSPKPHIQTHLHSHEPALLSPLLYLQARGPDDIICIMHMHRKNCCWILFIYLIFIFWVGCCCSQYVGVGASSAWQIKSPPHPGLFHSGQASDGWRRRTWIRTVARKTADPNGATTYISSAKSVITAVAGGGAQMENCYQEYARSVYNTSC